MLKKFEVGKVYCYKSGSGIGVDQCIYDDYYLITRKNEKNIWWKKISVARELYLRANNEKADFKKFEKAVEKRSKINIYKEKEEEYFIDTRESGTKDYIFFEYVDEVELN